MLTLSASLSVRLTFSPPIGDTMKRTFTQKQKQAIRGYYLQRKARFLNKSKLRCLEEIRESIKDSRNIKTFTACAGTFWFTWKSNVVTQHSEKNWWRMKKFVVS